MKLMKIIPFVEFVYYTGIVNISKNTATYDSSEYGMMKNKGMEIKGGLKLGI